jgi:steroid delta-isomerase-like uncharacterized protein
MTATVRAPSETAKAFFDAYRRQDIEAMVDLCDDNADFRYVPAEGWLKQRVIRGKGKVRGVGKTYWTALINAFPDLTNEVKSVSHDADGNVVCEVVIGGTQEKDFDSIGCVGKRYDLPHLFFLHVNDQGLIDDIAGYWDGAEWFRQLGRVEVD